MKKLRIVSNGTTIGTFVEDAETGERIAHVVKVEWQCDAHNPESLAVITVLNVPVVLESRGEEQVCAP